MAEDGGKMNSTETTEGGKAGRKSANITASLTRGIPKAVTPNGKQPKEREQDAPKKLRTDMKKGLQAYFGAGKRIPAPSNGGNPILAVVQRREGQGNTPRGKSGNDVELNAEKEENRDNNKTMRSTPNTKK
jgi:hypothetical protein